MIDPFKRGKGSLRVWGRDVRWLVSGRNSEGSSGNRRTPSGEAQENEANINRRRKMCPDCCRGHDVHTARLYSTSAVCQVPRYLGDDESRQNRKVSRISGGNILRMESFRRVAPHYVETGAGKSRLLVLGRIGVEM